MKRMLLMLIALMLATPVLAESPAMEIYAAQLTEDMKQLIADDAYVAMYAGGFPFLQGNAMQCLSGCAWMEPVCDVYLTIDEAALLEAMRSQGFAMPENLSEVPPQYLTSLVGFAVLPPLTMESAIVSNVAYASVFYVDPGQRDGMMMFVRFYADGVPVLYSCHAQDSAVILTATALADLADLPTDDALAALQTHVNNGMMPIVRVSQEPVMLCDGPFCELPTGSIAQRAVFLAQKAERMIADPAHRQLLGLTEEQDATVAEWSQADCAAPRLMVAVEMDARVHGVSIWGKNAAKILAAEDSVAARVLDRMVYGSYFGTLLYQYGGGSDATVMANASTAIAFFTDQDQPDGNGAYILLYDGGHAMLVVWSAQSGVVSMSAQYLPIPGLAACQSATEIALWFAENASPVVCTEVVPE